MDEKTRQWEREFFISPTKELAKRLIAIYLREKRELDYLKLLDQWGPRLLKRGKYVRSGLYQKLIYPRLTDAQEQRFQHLMWIFLMESAIEADKTGLLDIKLLREAEAFADRSVYSIWDYNIFLETRTGGHLLDPHPNEDKDHDIHKGTIVWRTEDTDKAKIYCKYDDEGIELFDKVDYEKYWSEDGHYTSDPWESIFDPNDPHFGYVGGGNLTGIGFFYVHRNCSHDPSDNLDYGPPPDTPSLPPRGTADPHWRF